MEFYRGDTHNFKFQRKSNGKVIEKLDEDVKIYFTVKNGYYDNALKIIQNNRKELK